MRRVKTARRIAPALLAVAALVAAAGCGTAAGPAGDDPAAVVPAGAPVFAEADLRPSGRQAANAGAVLRRALGTNDPAGALAALLDRKGDRNAISFARDVRPWLGDRVGVAVTGMRGRDTDSVVIAASTDDAKAQAALAKLVGGGASRSYRGVSYRVGRGGRVAAGIVDHFAVAGGEAAFKAAVDASKGDSLAGSSTLRAARDEVARDRLGFLYLDVPGLVDGAARSAGGDPTKALVLQALAGALPKTIAAALQADRDALRVDAAALGTPKALSTGRSGADALAALPGSAWLGLGVADLGGTLDGLLQTVAGAGGLNGLGVQALLGQARARTGLDLQRDVLSWMGDAGLFVSGTSPARVGGALVVATSNRAKTRATIAALGRLIGAGGARVSALHAKGVDDGVVVRSPNGRRTWIALAGDRFIVATGARRALSEAVSPGRRLGSSPALAAAADRLGAGVRPSLFVDLRRLGALMGAKGHARGLHEYLAAFGALGGGAKDEGGGVTRARFVVTLR